MVHLHATSLRFREEVEESGQSIPRGRPSLQPPRWGQFVGKAVQESRGFEAVGISVRVVGSFYEESDVVVGRVDAASILQGVISVGSSDDVDGVFVSCTSLRAASVIPEAERALNKPVTASNHALAWHLLRLAEIPDTNPNAGRLFQMQLA